MSLNDFGKNDPLFSISSQYRVQTTHEESRMYPSVNQSLDLKKIAKGPAKNTSLEVAKLQEMNREAWLQEKSILEELIRKQMSQQPEERVQKARQLLVEADKLPPKVPRKTSLSSQGIDFSLPVLSLFL